MKVFYFALVVFPSFQLTLSFGNISDTQENVTKKNNLWTVKSVVIPLLDVGVLWAEDRIVRSKRNPAHLPTTNPLGFINSIMQQKKGRHQIDSSDAFVDSMVSLMARSDPALLLKLHKKIEQFQSHQPMNSRNFRAQNQRPLIQFFNVTKISVSSDDDDYTRTKIGEESSLSRSEDEDYKNKADPDETGSDFSPKTDVTTFLKTRDGKIAKIQRSQDRKCYRLEIDYTTKTSQRDDSESEELQAERKKRKVRIAKEPSVTDRYVGYLQGLVGSSSGDSLVKHSFHLHNRPRMYSLI